MFFRRPLFYFAPDADNGVSVDDAPVDTDGGDDKEGISDAEVAANDGKVEEGGATEPEPDDASLASRVQAPDLSEVWKQHKLDGLPSDPQQLMAQIQAGQRAQQEAEQYKNHLLWQMHNQQQMQRPAPAAPAAPAKVFNIPEYDPKYLNYVTTDEQGNLIPRPGHDPKYVQIVRDFAAAKEAEQIRFLQDPIGALQPHLMPIIQQQAMAISQQQVQEYARMRELQNYDQQNAGWIYNNGVDASAGVHPSAEIFNRHYHYALNQLRHPNPIGYADAMMKASAYDVKLEEEVKSGQQNTAVEKARAADGTFIRNVAARQANRGGTMPNKTTPKPPQNPKDLWGSLRKRIEALPPGAMDEK